MRTTTGRRGAAITLTMAVASTVLGGSAFSDHRAMPPGEPVCHPAVASGPAGHSAPGTVSATIPRLVVVRLDRSGHPSRLWTNTGTCPVGDEQIVGVQAGHRGSVTARLRREIRRHVYRGDWSAAGVWHAW